MSATAAARPIAKKTAFSHVQMSAKIIFAVMSSVSKKRTTPKTAAKQMTISWHVNRRDFLYSETEAKTLLLSMFPARW